MGRVNRGLFYVVIKGLLGVLSTVLVSTAMNENAFSLWILLLSISVFVTLSDFGLGQYLVVKLVEINDNESASKSEKIKLLSKYAFVFLLLAAILILLSVLYLFSLFQFETLIGWRWVVIVSLMLVGFRMCFIPILAMVNSEGRYDERKKLEAIAYTLFVGFTYIGILFELEYFLYIIMFQMLLCIPVIYFFIEYVKFDWVYFQGYRLINIKWTLELFKKGYTYFVINLASFFTRMGIPILAGVSLSSTELSIVGFAVVIYFQGGFQMVDLLVKLAQPKYKKYLNRSYLLKFIALITFMVISIIGASEIIDLYVPAFHYSTDIYVLLGGVFIAESYLHYLNSLLVMTENNSRGVMKIVFFRMLIIMVIGVSLGFEWLCLSSIVTGFGIAILIRFKLFRRKFKIESSFLL